MFFSIIDCRFRPPLLSIVNLYLHLPRLAPDHIIQSIGIIQIQSLWLVNILW